MPRQSRSLRRGKCNAIPEATISQSHHASKAKSMARRLGLTLREVCSGDYRVNFRDGNESTAYYTDNLEDAVNIAVEMAQRPIITMRRI
jgi:hypothetical protein